MRERERQKDRERERVGIRWQDVRESGTGERED